MLTTIGYERATLADFVATLQLVEIDILVDIRERAQSRRPGFSKKALEAAVQDVGIKYIHLPQLGDPKEGRDAARSGNMSRFLEIYHSIINKAPALLALDRLESLASNSNICLMCFERDHRDCHRKLVAEELELRLNIKALHSGVVQGAGDGGRDRRVLYPYQGAAASF